MTIEGPLQPGAFYGSVTLRGSPQGSFHTLSLAPGYLFLWHEKKHKFLASRKSELKGTQLNPSPSSFTTPQQIRKSFKTCNFGERGQHWMREAKVTGRLQGTEGVDVEALKHGTEVSSALLCA